MSGGVANALLRISSKKGAVAEAWKYATRNNSVLEQLMLSGKGLIVYLMRVVFSAAATGAAFEGLHYACPQDTCATAPTMVRLLLDLR
jgi:hypothetical protein